MLPQVHAADAQFAAAVQTLIVESGAATQQ